MSEEVELFVAAGFLFKSIPCLSNTGGVSIGVVSEEIKLFFAVGCNFKGVEITMAEWADLVWRIGMVSSVNDGRACLV